MQKWVSQNYYEDRNMLTYWSLYFYNINYPQPLKFFLVVFMKL